jgi:DNA-binding XRE family transcriptional regulator
MAKTELSYSIDSCLDNYINREVGKRMSVNGGIKVTKKDIIAELAKYCGLTWEGINRIKRGMSLPSLPVALKIAEYFNENVENIFKLS